MNSSYYSSSEHEDDLQEKINKKFIRNVVKPYPLSQLLEKKNPLESVSPSIDSSFRHYSDSFSNKTYIYPEENNPIPVQRIPSSSSLYQQNKQPVWEYQSLVEPTPNDNIQPTPRPILYKQETTKPVKENAPLKKPNTHYENSSAIHCVAINEHIKKCPVCSELYRPYFGIMLTVIIILVIVILFLLKKIFQF